MNLRVSEMFYSVQGEGKSVGVPSVFLRLTGCVLSCGFCDTTEVWKKGVDYSMDDLLRIFDKEGYTGALRRNAHLILTGGDPLIQQNMLYYFASVLLREVLPAKFVVELETEGVIQPETLMTMVVSWFNVSPKLANSGIPESRRYKPNVLGFHARRDQDIFKFAVSKEEDVFEALKLSESLSVPLHRIWIMPICSTRKEHEETSPMIAELAKKYGCNFSPRLQLVLWDKAVGV
jgi:7-carboxy-7-deazaguanine synthase